VEPSEALEQLERMERFGARFGEEKAGTTTQRGRVAFAIPLSRARR
jgi:hypothetical protein